LEFGGVEVLVARVDRPKLAAVDGQQFAAEEFQFAAQERELPADRGERLEVVLAEVGDGFEVGRQLAQQPEDFDVTVTFGLEQPGITHAMQVTVEVELEQRGRSVGRTARVGADGSGEAQRVQFQRGDEGGRGSARGFRPRCNPPTIRERAAFGNDPVRRDGSCL